MGILDYYNQNVSQSDFVEYVKGEIINEGAESIEIEPGFSHWGVDSTIEYHALTFNEIMDEVYNQNDPIYSVLSYFTGGAHAVVIMGFWNGNTPYQQYVYYEDPANSSVYMDIYDEFEFGKSRYWANTMKID